ncbi:MAG TPA: pantoate--beta-alanine ligase [Bacteroidia bacterium]|nr:pantoate--beta-alanine ligase [Bacteroidia bacterium]
MKVVGTISQLDSILDPHRAKEESIGFVPTMGALHKGHVSLINIARSENKIVVCSIFVNPTQFNDPADLKRYPRPVEDDMRMLEAANCNILFMPSVEEMYPDGDFTTQKEDFGTLDKVMEGASRPGHFAGMITIVNRLFLAVKPNNAYFGQKDFQQLAIVKRFVEKHVIPINIKSCPIVRDYDGLAMSSRNRLLSAEERKRALLIPQTLLKVKEMWDKSSVTDIKKFVEDEFKKDGFLRLDYFQISDAKTLQAIKDKSQPAVACIAVFDGNIRLIDNVLL